MRCPQSRDQLGAYLDGELTTNEAVAVREHMAGCPNCASHYATLASTSRQLKEGLVHYTAPDMLKARILNALSNQRTPAATSPASWLHWSRLAAAALVIAVASSAGTAAVLHRGVASRSVADELLASHLRSLMPGHLTDVASNDHHNVKPWFNGRVALSPSVPALDSAGFVLVGGRLDYVASRPVAVVVYSRRQHVINVYAWPDGDGDRSASSLTAHDYHMVSWRNGDVESWAVSDLNPAELGQFVALLRRGAG
ncbi:MAG: anti-sigma factor [Gemmatimonadota bacterium]|nr:anti-sigma factor [Gemmatimonadota bacterium]